VEPDSPIAERVFEVVLDAPQAGPCQLKKYGGLSCQPPRGLHQSEGNADLLGPDRILAEIARLQPAVLAPAQLVVGPEQAPTAAAELHRDVPLSRQRAALVFGQAQVRQGIGH